MKRISAVAALVIFAGSFVSGQSVVQKVKQGGTAEDEMAIRGIVDHWRQTWDNFDASFLQRDFADDADWLNAFGVRKKGSAEILAFVAGVVKRQNVQGRHTTWDEPSVRFVRPDVALAYRDYRTVGMKAPDGKDMGQRNTHSTWLLTKDNGSWHIVSQIISDER